MKVWQITSCVAVLSLVLPIGGFAAEVTGTVSNQAGKPVPGVEVLIKSPHGKVVSQAKTDSKGHYAAKHLSPGHYEYVLDPGASGVKGGTTDADVESSGSTVDWRVSDNLMAAAAVLPGANGPATIDGVAAGSAGGSRVNTGSGASPLFAHTGPVGSPVGGSPGGVGSSSD
jgi:hypothetical protein